MNKATRLQQDFDEVERRVNAQDGAGDRTTRDALTRDLFDPQPVAATPAKPPQDQQIRDGDFSFSVNGYLDTVAAPGTDKVREAAWWFSNDSVVAGQALDFTTAETSSVNKTLKATSHSNYNAVYCDWDDAQGVARMTGTKSLDAPFPTSPVFPDRIEHMGAIIALRNDQIRITNDTHLGAYLYNNTPASEDVMKEGSSAAPDATVRGTPAATTERRYKIFTRTDKGFTVLSAERTVAAAPSDADFATTDVYLTWASFAGAIEYHVYRHDITAAKYRLLLVISSGATSYADNNSMTNNDVGGYPAATYDRVQCYAATSDGDLSNLPVNGVALKWADLYLNIPVPPSLVALGVGHQVLRLQLDKALDREFAGVTANNGNTTISTVNDQFTALDAGRTVNLTSADGLHTLTTTISAFTDTKHVVLTVAPTWTDANTNIYIVGGGDHGLLIDMIHIGWIEQAKFSHYPDDLNRTLSPAAAPATSSQGGVGTGGGTGDPGDGGIVGCVAVWAPVTALLGNGYITMPASEVRRGWMLKCGDHRPNRVIDVSPSDCDNLHIIRTENGLELPCSPRQVLFTGFLDRRGYALYRLQVGDLVLTCRDGHDEVSPISEIIATGGQAKVVSYALDPGHKYLAGSVRLRWWQRLLYRFRRSVKPNGLYLHNRKLDQE